MRLTSTTCLLMRIGRRERHDLHDRHHAAILVREDMTVQHVLAGVVDEAAAHFEIAGHQNHLRVVGKEYGAPGGNWKHIPPYPARRRWRVGAGLPAIGPRDIEQALIRSGLSLEDIFVG